MFLSHVHVLNFRSLREMSVHLRSGLNVLVGRNNTGKTNLLHAIRHAIGPSASRGDSVWLDRDDFFKESVLDQTQRSIVITLTFEGLTPAQRAHFYEIVDFDLSDISKSKAIIRYEASWPSDKRQASVRRTGGSPAADQAEVPSTILQSLPITFLPALRDAEAYLAPGYRSRLATLLKDTAIRKGSTTKADIEAIYIEANKALEDKALISETVTSLQATTRELAGTDYASSAIRAAEVEFDKILRSLQVQMDGAPVGALEANGLGYNNLLYIAVVLEHLKEPFPDESPLFLVEEPEAHLHPQLTLLLANYLATKTPGGSTPQSKSAISDVECNSVSRAGLTETEEHQLQRMLDVTKATLYFAKGLILVEGISEALLLPVLAKRIGYDLGQKHISVIPICGVAFETFRKLFNPQVLGIPVVIVTDSDPDTEADTVWSNATPISKDGQFARCARTQKLLAAFSGHPTVKIYVSQVTLEYDLAEAGHENAMVMANVWESCFETTPRTFNRDLVLKAGDNKADRALAAWRGICCATHRGSKAEFAHRLADHLLEKSDGTWTCSQFVVPPYLKSSIEDVASRQMPVPTE